jgi:predicted RNA binding protein YcfA (HicA-like mRNA interferase family)
MPKLPQVRGTTVVKFFQSLGYEFVRQRGSHIRMKKITSMGEHNITVPAHAVVAKGTLGDIIGKGKPLEQYRKRRTHQAAQAKLSKDGHY